MKSTFVSVAIAVALAGAFLACGNHAKEIKIGGVGPLTGEAVTFGTSTREGYDMAVAEANAKGGLLGKQVKLVFADDKGDPAEGATVYTKLIEQDKVKVKYNTVPDAYATLAYVATNIKFDDHRNPVKSAVIIQIKDGKQVYKATVNP